MFYLIVGFLLGFQFAGMCAVFLLYSGLGYSHKASVMWLDALLWPIFFFTLFQKD